MYYENKPLAGRFPELTPKDRLGGYRLTIKSIIRGKLPYVKITNIHRGDENLKKLMSMADQRKLIMLFLLQKRLYKLLYWPLL